MIVLYTNSFYQTFGKRSFRDCVYHAQIAQKVIDGYFIPHPGLHISVIVASKLSGLSINDSMILMLSIYVTLTAFIIYRILSWKLGDRYCDGVLLLLTLCLMVVAAIYIPWFSKHMYLGQGNPNIIFSSTMVALKPFELITFILFLLFLDTKGGALSWKHGAAFSLALATSILVKPSFAIIFVPAACLYIFFSDFWNIKQHFKFSLLLLPSLFLLVWQAYNTFILTQSNGYKGRIILDYFRLWGVWSPSIPVSLLLALAFPLSFALFYPRKILQNAAMKLCWLMLFFGILQFGMFAEPGSYYLAGNFSWGYNVALSFLFIFSTVEFFKEVRNSWDAGLYGRIKSSIVILFFAAHLFSGFIFIYRLFAGGGYR
jgi:hypothetical protein